MELSLVFNVSSMGIANGGGGPTYCSDAAKEASGGDSGIRGPMPLGRPKITSAFAVICSPGEMGMEALSSGLLVSDDDGCLDMAASTLCLCSCSLIQCPDGGGGTTNAFGVMGAFKWFSIPSDTIPPTGM